MGISSYNIRTITPYYLQLGWMILLVSFISRVKMMYQWISLLGLYSSVM
jgi:hypothetical protein